MFGNKKKISQEEIQKLQDSLEEGRMLLEEISKQQEVFESDREAIAQSQQHLSEDVEQAAQNSRDVIEYAKQNAAQAADLSSVLEEKALAAQKAFEEYRDICNVTRSKNRQTDAVRQWSRISTLRHHRKFSEN